MKRMIQSINPYNNELIAEFQETLQNNIDSILKVSQDTFERQKKKPFSYRSNLLKNCAKLLRENKMEYARIITLEMGKVIKESVQEVEKCAWVCDYYAENGEKFLADKKIKLSKGKGLLTHQPLGVVLGVMPWNFPFWQVFRFAVPTIMAGNTVILKHASNVPHCSIKIQEIFEEAGFSKGTFQSVLLTSSAIKDLIEDDRIKGVSLTGSEGAGSKVGELAGKNIKKMVLELGGSDPFLVLPGADVIQAAQTASKARMLNCGQSCIAAKRFIVHESVSKLFLNHFRDEMNNLVFGDPLGGDTDFASLANQKQQETLSKQVEESITKGADMYWFNVEVKNHGAFFNPMILTNITRDMPAYSDELFGPVASVFVVNSIEEAIKTANDTNFGLGASVWSEDKEEAQTVAREIESGIVYINDMVASRPELPFGGVKKSGVGRELSELGIKEFTNAKAIWMP